MKQQQSIRENDYQTGLQAEQQCCKLLKSILGDKVQLEATTRYCYKDFVLTSKKTSEKYAIEHKLRLDISKKTFDTTVIPWSKILQFIKKDNERCADLLLIFTFNDGCFYVSARKLAKLRRKDSRIQVKNFQRHKGFTHNSRPHLFIPVEYLKPIESLKI